MRKEGNLSGFRKQAETSFGKKILSHKECIELQTEIFQKTGELLSLNTLRRFFCLIKSAHTPSVSTLNVLARYCGYRSYGEWHQVEAEKETTGENADLLQYMTLLFSDTTVQDGHDKTYGNLVYNTIRFLNKNHRVVDAFQQAISKTKNGQAFYFESFVHIDRLNGFYGNGLRHYLAEKKTKEAQIFGNSLLALRFWLTENDEALLHDCNQVLQHKLDPGIHPFVCGRYFGTRLLKARTEKKALTPVLSEAKEYYRRLTLPKDVYATFPCFELTYGGALLLAGQWQETLDYTAQGISKLQKVPPQTLNNLLQTFYLFNAKSLAHLGHTEEALTLFDKIDPARFYSLGRQFNTVLYLQTGLLLKKTKGKAQLEHLIAETGFTRLCR